MVNLNNAWLCGACYESVHHIEPDMGMGLDWKPANCENCKSKDIIVFKVED